MREGVAPSIDWAIARARTVFAVPGTSSKRTWPPQTRAARTSLISSCLPWTIVAVVVGDNAGHRDLSLLFFGKVLAAVSRRLTHSDYEALLLEATDASVQHRFDAAILIGVDHDDAIVLELASQGVPLVGVDVRL